MEHYDVLIVTPGHSMVREYVKSLTDTIIELDKLDISWKWLGGYSSLVHNAREISLTGDGLSLCPDDKGPLHDQCTYEVIVWIDSDVSWTPKDFFKLMSSKYEITAGAYLGAHGGSSINMEGFPTGAPKEVILQMKEMTAVHSVGFGFIAIKPGVFEKIERPWFGMLNQQVNTSDGRQINISLGEDVSWCMKAQQAGFQIWFDPEVLVTHIKTISLQW
jgi:hypothetical protein